MSDEQTPTDGDADGRESAAGSDAGNGQPAAVERVVDALTPLLEQTGHARGFAVKHPRERSPGEGALNREVVEVRFYTPERHPREVDMARGMLQGAGYSPVKEQRGRCIRLAVPVHPDGEPRDAEREPRGKVEQTRFAGGRRGGR